MPTSPAPLTQELSATSRAGCLIIADDLTGACDAAAPFAACGQIAVVQFAMSALHIDTNVLAVTTESRDTREDISLMRLDATLHRLGASTQNVFFKKVDSLCRGNTFAEIGLIDSRFPARLIFFTPCFAAVGRTVANGRLHLDHTRDSVLDISEALRSRAIIHCILPEDFGEKEQLARIRQFVASGNRFFLCDSSSTSSLRTLGRTALSLDRELVWIGSGGLADALANVLHPATNVVTPWRRSDGALICCIGSKHATTIEQIRHATLRGVVTCAQSNGAFHSALPEMLRKRGTLLWVMDPELDREVIRAALSPIREYPETTLLLSGGTTAAHTCEALSVQSISIAGELMPGIPWGYVRGGDVDGTRVITKSGGFGAEDVFTAIMIICQRSQ